MHNYPIPILYFLLNLNISETASSCKVPQETESNSEQRTHETDKHGMIYYMLLSWLDHLEVTWLDHLEVSWLDHLEVSWLDHLEDERIK